MHSAQIYQKRVGHPGKAEGRPLEKPPGLANVATGKLDPEVGLENDLSGEFGCKK
jgi:hypothetical protein